MDPLLWKYGPSSRLLSCWGRLYKGSSFYRRGGFKALQLDLRSTERGLNGYGKVTV